jgi:hypothetical protein
VRKREELRQQRATKKGCYAAENHENNRRSEKDESSSNNNSTSNSSGSNASLVLLLVSSVSWLPYPEPALRSCRRSASLESLARFKGASPSFTVTLQLEAPPLQCCLKQARDSHHQQPWLSVYNKCNRPPGGRNSDGVHIIPDCRPGTACAQ